MNKARGPPPGLSTKVPQSNWSCEYHPFYVDSLEVCFFIHVPDYFCTATTGSRTWRSTPSGWGSSWLLLRNLTPQIDGSTLKTLCLQHGPLQNFHLYLNQGVAFAKYSSREEASKVSLLVFSASYSIFAT